MIRDKHCFLTKHEQLKCLSIVEEQKFNKKSLRKAFSQVSIDSLIHKKANFTLTEREVPSNRTEVATQVKTLFLVPVVR